MRTLQTRLRKILSGRFSKDELHTLCFDLRIPYENLPEGLDGLAREMIVYCERRDRLPELIQAARELRPNADWGDLAAAAAPDAASVAAAAVALLSPYLAGAGEGAGRAAGEAAWEKARQIHRAIAARLQQGQDDYPSETLKRFEEQPEARRGAMQSVLQEVLGADPAFARALSALLQEADRAGAGAVFNVKVYGGEVGQIINVDHLEGGLTIHDSQAGDER